MGIVAKQGLYNSIWQYVGILLGYVNTVLLFPVILKTEEFGLTRVLWSAATLSTTFALSGAQGVLIKFYPKFNDNVTAVRRFITTTLLFSGIGLSFVVAVIYLFKPEINQWFTDNSKLFPLYFHLFPLLLLYNGLFTYFENYLRVHLRTSVATFLRTVVLRIFWLVLIALIHFRYIDFDFFVHWYVHALGITTLLLLGYAFPAFSKELGGGIITKTDLKPLVRFALYAVLGAGSGYLANYIDVIMVGGMIDLKSAAIYSVAFYISSVITVPLNAVNKVTVPIVARLWKEENIVKLNNLYRQTANSMLLISLWIFLGIWCNVDNIFAILPPEYAQGRWVILFISLAKLYDASFGINGQIIQFSEKYRWMLFFNIVMAVIVLATNMLLIPRWGVSGAAFATLLSITTLNTIRLFFLKKQFGLFPFSGNDIKIVFTGIGVYLLQMTLPALPLWIDILVRSAVITTVYFGIAALWGSSPELTKFIRRFSSGKNRK